MPLFDLNNLEHTSCLHGGCGAPAGNTQIIYFAEEMLPAKLPPPVKEIIVSKLTRGDFTSQD
jgi:hypothetical protein